MCIALGVAAASGSASTKRSCKAKHEATGCVLNRHAAFYTGPGISVQARALPARFGGNSLELYIVPNGSAACFAGRFIVPKVTVTAGRKSTFRSGSMLSGSIDVSASGGTLVLKTHADAVPPSPAGLGGRSACTSTVTYKLKRSG